MSWLDELKEGDEVIVSSSRQRLNRIATVSKITKTQIVVGTSRFNKRSGSLVPYSAWNSSSLEEATPERKAEVREANKRVQLLHKLSGFGWSVLPTEVLEKVVELISEVKQ